MNFEWQTEESEGWEAGTPLPADSRSRRASARKRWPAILFLLLVLTGALFLAYWRIQERVAVTEALVRERVLASHQLLQEAVAREDDELFVNILSGRDEGWTEAQKALLAQGLLFDRPGLGVRLLPARHDPVPEVNLAPGLDQATVTFRQTYVLTAAATASRTIQLAHQAIYRKGPRQWLYAPPADAGAFWGEIRRHEGARLTVSYPARDAEVAQRLATDLDAKLVALCQQPKVVCAGGWHFFLQLSADPELVGRLAAAEQIAALDGHLEIALPAPTLVGLPIGDGAYQVLFEAYANYVLTSAIANLTAYNCCRQALFFRALVEQHLVELGVRPALLSPADGLALMDSFRPVAAMDGLWNRTLTMRSSAAEWRLVRAFVAFLLAQGAGPAAVWQQALGDQPTLAAWVRQVVGNDNGTDGWAAFAQEWMEEAVAQQGDLPRPLPAESLLLACRAEGTDDLVLVRHRPGSDDWRQEQVMGGEWASLLSLPGGEAVLVYRYGVPRGATRTFAWQPAGLRALISARSRGTSALLPLAYTPASPALDPRGQFLVLLRWNQEERVQGGYRLFDLACTGSVCEDSFFPGIPVWAPDGNQLLAGNGRRLWRMTRAALDERLVEFRGRLPFWLDNTTYGFLSDGALLVGNSADDQLRPILHLEQLATFLPTADRLPLEIVQVLAPADRPDRLLIVAQMPARARTFIFQVERSAGGPSFLLEAADLAEISLLWQYQGEQSPLAYLLDGGRLLVLSSTGRTGSHVRVFDLARAQQLFETVLGERMGTVDYSADGDWLALAGDHFVELVALPAAGGSPARHILFPPFAGCTSATWIQPAGS